MKGLRRETRVKEGRKGYTEGEKRLCREGRVRGRYGRGVEDHGKGLKGRKKE